MPWDYSTAGWLAGDWGIQTAGLRAVRLVERTAELSVVPLVATMVSQMGVTQAVATVAP